MPKSVTKVRTKAGKSTVEFTSNVDRAKYTMLELERAALRDVGKFLRKEVKNRIPKDSGDARKSIGTWNKTPYRGKAAHLSIGNYTKAASQKKGKEYTGHYFHILEFGSKYKRAIKPLRSAVFQNINRIRDIQAKYLKFVEDEQKAKALIDESEDQE
jgi:HK97 gp10 family phage protein